ncbi:MAG: DUF5723 family protein [Prevotella sp.]|nr:DUF5723 family protein [Prevotella sp.]
MRINYIRYILVLVVLVFLMIGKPVAAQELNSAYFTDGFLYRHQMNPALTDSINYIAVPGVGNINLKMMGNFGYQDVVRYNPLFPTQSSKKMTTFMNPYIEDALDGFNKNNNKVNAQAKIGILSVGFNGLKGYNTIDVNARAILNLRIPYEYFEFARNIGNNHYDLGDIDAEAIAFTEIAFGHSHKISDQLKVGGKFKVLLGLGDAKLSLHNMTVDLADNQKWTVFGDVKSDVSIKGFEYQSEMKEYKSRADSYQRVKDVNIDGLGISGLGAALDLGVEWEPTEKWNVSLALLDLGFICWNKDYYATNTQKNFVFDGFHDITLDKDSEHSIDTQADSYADQFMDFAHLEDQGEQGNRTSSLGATLNIGASYQVLDYLKLGLLSSTKINGIHSWTEGRVSANFSPFKWLDGGFNFALNSYTGSVGWIVNIHPKRFNFFIGMDHLIGKMSKEMIPLSSNASLSTGFNITF